MTLPETIVRGWFIADLESAITITISEYSYDVIFPQHLARNNAGRAGPEVDLKAFRLYIDEPEPTHSTPTAATIHDLPDNDKFGGEFEMQIDVAQIKIRSLINSMEATMWGINRTSQTETATALVCISENKQSQDEFIEFCKVHIPYADAGHLSDFFDTVNMCMVDVAGEALKQSAKLINAHPGSSGTWNLQAMANSSIVRLQELQYRDRINQLGI